MRAQLLEDDEAVKAWRDCLGPSWDKQFNCFKLFCVEVLAENPVFAKLSPSDLVDWQSNAKGRENYQILKLAQRWINTKNLRFSTKRSRLSYIRSFFLHNYAPLPPDRSFQFRGDKPPVVGKLSLDAFKRIIMNSNTMYRAVFLFMAQHFFGENEFNHVNLNCWREVLEHLTKGDGEFKIVLPGRKQKRNIQNYYVVSNTRADWAEAYKRYLRSSPHKVTGCLFRNERGKPLSAANINYYFHSRAVEAGVIKQHTPSCSKCRGETIRLRKGPKGRIAYQCGGCGLTEWASDCTYDYGGVRYGVNPHEIRDLMRSRWQVSGADSVVCEFFMGHEVDPNFYNKFWKYEPWYPIQEYRKALRWLNILSEEPDKLSRTEVEEQLEASKTEVDVLSKEVAVMKRKMKVLDDPRLLEILEEREKE